MLLAFSVRFFLMCLLPLLLLFLLLLLLLLLLLFHFCASNASTWSPRLACTFRRHFAFSLILIYPSPLRHCGFVFFRCSANCSFFVFFVSSYQSTSSEFQPSLLRILCCSARILFRPARSTRLQQQLMRHTNLKDQPLTRFSGNKRRKK